MYAMRKYIPNTLFTSIPNTKKDIKELGMKIYINTLLKNFVFLSIIIVINIVAIGHWGIDGLIAYNMASNYCYTF